MVALNHNANRTWLSSYAPYIGPIPGTIYTKEVAITYPMIFDSLATAFDAYQVDAGLLPYIFLVDQEGKIQLRYNMANDPAQFEEHLDEIITKIRLLLGY